MILKIKDIQRVGLGPDEVLVIRVPRDVCSGEYARRIDTAVKRAFGSGTKCLIATTDMEFFVIGKNEVEGKCFCGSDVLGSPKHSEYCPKYT